MENGNVSFFPGKPIIRAEAAAIIARVALADKRIYPAPQCVEGTSNP